VTGYDRDSRLDDYGRRVKALMEEVVRDYEVPVVWRIEPQTVENPHPTIVITARDTDRGLPIPKEDRLHITDDQIRELLGEHIQRALYG
jgi:hypothetical protein